MVQSTVPASVMRAGFSKKLYVYLGMNVAAKGAPPDPEWLTLGPGSPQVTVSRISATEFSQAISFTFRVGNDNST